MRRWNGWGDATIQYPLPAHAKRYLAEKIESGMLIPDATLESVLASTHKSRLPQHPLITTNPLERLLHARGQSLPDWIALRSGRIGVCPDGVAYPSSEEEIRSLFTYAHRERIFLIPYGGGTSVVGHITPLERYTPVVTVDLSRMNQLLSLDEISHLATFGAGVNGPTLESRLNRLGYTLGHFPQSFEQSTLGGWIATRSSGQQSFYYGRIEDLFAGGYLETFVGALELKPFPASAAGPDLRQIVLGSEGRLGIISQATVRIRPLPEAEGFYGILFPDWESGVEAIRSIAQKDVLASMIRLSNPQETEITLALSGGERSLSWIQRGLSLLGFHEQRCLLIFAVTGSAKEVSRSRKRIVALTRNFGGLYIGSLIGKTWQKKRFLTPYLRNSLWDLGYATDTLETAVPWSAVHETTQAILEALTSALSPFNERVLAFAHLSHVYTDGASVYVTFIFRRTADPDETFERWQLLKSAASQAIQAHGGTISHQHGIGLDHTPYLLSEKGSTGLALLEAACKALDPDGLMNPGKLLPNR